MTKLISYATFYARLFLAIFVWFVWVPYLTIWIWRVYFDPFSTLLQWRIQDQNDENEEVSLISSWFSEKTFL
jgi:hypothetical protein